MKKYIVAAGLFLLMNSCLNNDFMEVYPKDQQTELTSFRSYENFKTYSWGLYNVFFGYAYKTGQTDEIFKGDYEADNMIKHVSSQAMKANGRIKKLRYLHPLIHGIMNTSAG